MGRFPVLIGDQCDVSLAGAKATCVGNAGAYCVHKERLSSKAASGTRRAVAARRSHIPNAKSCGGGRDAAFCLPNARA